MINKRISDSSCDKEEFNKIKSVNVTVIPKTVEEIETGRLYGSTQHIADILKIIIGELFIKHVRKHLLKNSKHHKIFKLNTLKLSYCSTTNIENIIRQRKSKRLSKAKAFNSRKRNCRSKPNWPSNGKCLTQCLVYKALTATSNSSFGYYGTSEG